MAKYAKDCNPRFASGPKGKPGSLKGGGGKPMENSRSAPAGHTSDGKSSGGSAKMGKSYDNTK